MLPMRVDDFCNGHAGGVGGKAPASGQPLGNNPVVFGSACGGAVRAQVEVSTLKTDNGLSAGLVVTVGGNGYAGIAGHGGTSKNKPVDYRIIR
jgi:hypothetical protein